MSKSLILALIVLGAVGFQCPVSAMLNEDYVMLRSFYANPGLWPIEKHEWVKGFAKVRKELRPQMLQFYPDAAGQIQREYWQADSTMWTVAQANRIRNAIMKNSNAVSSQNTGFRAYEFVYADGARVFYRMARGKVFSILAVRKDFDPGDFGVKPDAFWRNMHIIRPDE